MQPEVEDEVRIGKELYSYQIRAVDQIFSYFQKNTRDKYNLLFQLPTGGGKTVIFSEITRRFIEETDTKVLILTHRIELCGQTERMLTEFGVNTMVINSSVKKLPKDNNYRCFIAMVETLNNRLTDEDIKMENLGLIIVDEAHNNSFNKLFKFFEKGITLGVTATPLSSNINLPMHRNYHELIVGESISSLIEKGFLAKPDVHRYDVGLSGLKIGINGDYTVKSSELLYANLPMQEKLIKAYEEQAKGKKVLIFNNGIRTSKQVYINFQDSGYDIRHLDNKTPAKERKEILEWFKVTPGAILTSVSILTTGFDEPTVESVILNRATRSLTLYFQMIGRGSRILPTKNSFKIIDLGNNVARFGPWEGDIDWQRIFRSPDFYLQNIMSDEEIERRFVYKMPEDLKLRFANSTDIDFDVYTEYDKVMSEKLRPPVTLERSLAQHVRMCVENSEDVYDARELARLLEDDIAQRVEKYSYCITKSTLNYRRWLREDYMTKLRKELNKHFD